MCNPFWDVLDIPENLDLKTFLRDDERIRFLGISLHNHTDISDSKISALRHVFEMNNTMNGKKEYVRPQRIVELNASEERFLDDEVQSIAMNLYLKDQSRPRLSPLPSFEIYRGAVMNAKKRDMLENINAVYNSRDSAYEKDKCFLTYLSPFIDNIDEYKTFEELYNDVKLKCKEKVISKNIEPVCIDIHKIYKLKDIQESRDLIITHNGSAFCVSFNPSRYDPLTCNLEQQKLKTTLYTTEIKHTCKTLSEARNFVKYDGLGELGTSYVADSEGSRTTYRCNVHVDCKNVVEILQRQNSIRIVQNGNHSKTWNTRVQPAPYYHQHILRKYADGITPRNICAELSKLKERSGDIPDIPKHKDVTNFIKNLNRRENKRYDENEEIQKFHFSNMPLKTGKQSHAFIGKYVKEGKTIITFFACGILNLLQTMKSAETSSIYRRVVFADTTYKFNRGTPKYKNLISFGIDTLRWNEKKKDWLATYIPVVFGFSDTENEWAYERLIQSAILVFALAGFACITNEKHFTIGRNNEYKTPPLREDVEGFVDATLNQIAKENQIYFEIDAIKSKITENNISLLILEVIISDYAAEIENAFTDVIGGKVMKDFPHINRSRTHSKKKLKNPKENIFGSGSSSKNVLDISSDLLWCLRMSPTQKAFDNVVDMCKHVFNRLGQTEYWENFEKTYISKNWRFNFHTIEGSLNMTSHMEKAHDLWYDIRKAMTGKKTERSKFLELLPKLACAVNRHYMETKTLSPKLCEYIPQYIRDGASVIAHVKTNIERKGSTFYVNNIVLAGSKQMRIIMSKKRYGGKLHTKITEDRIQKCHRILTSDVPFDSFVVSDETEDLEASMHQFKETMFGFSQVTIPTHIPDDQITYDDVVCECEDYYKHKHCSHKLAVSDAVFGIPLRSQMTSQMSSRMDGVRNQICHNIPINSVVHVPTHEELAKKNELINKIDQYRVEDYVGKFFYDEEEEYAQSYYINEIFVDRDKIELYCECLPVDDNENLTGGEKENYALTNVIYDMDELIKAHERKGTTPKRGKKRKKSSISEKSQTEKNEMQKTIDYAKYTQLKLHEGTVTRLYRSFDVEWCEIKFTYIPNTTINITKNELMNYMNQMSSQ